MRPCGWQMTVNGSGQEHDVEPRTLLVQYLREACGLTGTKVGCDTSSCGACTVLVDGESVKSCTMLAAQADGASSRRSRASPPSGELHPVQQAFHEHHGLQCGFCTAGMVMAAVSFLEENPNPTERDVRLGLEGNLCRCTGYHNIVQAVLAAAERRVAVVIPAAVRLRAGRLRRRRGRAARRARRRGEAARRRHVAAPADEAAPRDAERPRRRRPAARPLVRARRRRPPRDRRAHPPPRPRDERRCSRDRVRRAARGRGRGGRQPGAAPRHDRRLGRPRRPRVRPPRRAARARRHVRRPRARAASATIAADATSSQGFLETALAPDELLTEIRVPEDRAPTAFSYQKFNRRAQDWAIVGALAVAGRRRDAGRAREHGPDAAAGPRRSRRRSRRARRRPTPRAHAAEGTEPPADLNATSSTASTSPGCSTRRALEAAGA